jgi:hypothetical protein
MPRLQQTRPSEVDEQRDLHLGHAKIDDVEQDQTGDSIVASEAVSEKANDMQETGER